MSSRSSRSPPSSPSKSRSCSCKDRSIRPSPRGSSNPAAGWVSGGGRTSGIHSVKVIHRPSWQCGPGAINGLGETARPDGARNSSTETSRESHLRGSSWSATVPVITRATTGAGHRCTSTLLAEWMTTASSSFSPHAYATAAAAVTARCSSAPTIPGNLAHPITTRASTSAAGGHRLPRLPWRLSGPGKGDKPRSPTWAWHENQVGHGIGARRRRAWVVCAAVQVAQRPSARCPPA